MKRHLPLRSLICLLLAALTLGPAPRARALPDPTAPGPYAITKEEYNFGLSYFPANSAALPGFPGPVEFLASVHYPSTAANSGVVATTNPSTGGQAGPFPLIIFVHGRHGTAYNPTTGSSSSQWPPTGSNIQIPSYEGYDYAAETLASYGYVVVSIGADGINAVDNNTPDRGMLARAQLIQQHLNFLNTLTMTGQTSPDINGVNFGTKFVGKIDMTNIGTMGHSRGGEGVMVHAVYNLTQPHPYAIKAVLPIAPVDYNRYVVNNIPFGVILPYCDGDVSDNQGMHFYDDARYDVPGDPTAKYFWNVMGANHDYFNTVWTNGVFIPGAASGFGGAADDWQGTPGYNLDAYAYLPNDLLPPPSPKGGRLTAYQQQAVGRFYILAFFRTYIGGETQFLPYLKGEVPPPASTMTTALRFTYHAPDTPATRLDINRFLTPASLTTDTLGGAVSESGLSPFDVQGSGVTPELNSAIYGQPAARQPANTPSLYAPQALGLSQLRVGWNTPHAFLENDIPAGKGNVTGFTAMQFRAAVNFTDVRNMVAQDDFSVVLTDGAGQSASVPVSSSNYAASLNFPPGRIVRIPKVVLSMVRLPLSTFTGLNPNLNLTSIHSVKFVFDRQPSGSLLLTDLAFAN